jgi:hypothetical protein
MIRPDGGFYAHTAGAKNRAERPPKQETTMFTPIAHSFTDMSDIQEIALAAAVSPEYVAKALAELFGVGPETDLDDQKIEADQLLSVANAF